MDGCYSVYEADKRIMDVMEKELISDPQYIYTGNHNEKLNETII